MTRKPQKTRRRLLLLAAILILIVLLLLLLRACPAEETAAEEPVLWDLTEDCNAEAVSDTDAAESGRSAPLQENSMTISMNLSPVFADGQSEGNLWITNSSENSCPQIVEIYRKDTGALLYRSGCIPVGSRVETATLQCDLDPGVYDCTAYFYAVNPDTGQSSGCAGADIRLTVTA